jgi:hypothetical protein
MRRRGTISGILDRRYANGNGRSKPWHAWALRSPSHVRRHRRAGVSSLLRLAEDGPALQSKGKAEAGVVCLLGGNYFVGIRGNVDHFTQFSRHKNYQHQSGIRPRLTTDPPVNHGHEEGLFPHRDGGPRCGSVANHLARGDLTDACAYPHHDRMNNPVAYRLWWVHGYRVPPPAVSLLGLA